MRKIFFIILMMASMSLSIASSSRITVVDDSGQVFIFDKPLTRIISLAPHTTELLFSAGADTQILGTVSFSDYPAAAKIIPLIGSYVKVDYEKILALQPQLVIYWGTGNPQDMIDGLKKLNIKIFNNEPNSFAAIPASIRTFGKMLGTEKIAEEQAKQFTHRFERLKKKYADRYIDSKAQPVRVFYQVWNQPLMTFNKSHLVNEIIEFCGGVNIFSELDNITPTIDIESIIKRNPQVIIAGMSEGREDWLPEWQRWTSIDAVKNHHVYAINAEEIVRQTPRILDGTERMCEILQKVRNDAL